MCIICRCGDKGLDFISEFEKSMFHLKKAEHIMFECSKIDRDYDRQHKKLIKLRKDINRWYSNEREHKKLNGSNGNLSDEKQK